MWQWLHSSRRACGSQLSAAPDSFCVRAALCRYTVSYKRSPAELTRRLSGTVVMTNRQADDEWVDNPVVILENKSGKR